MSVSSVCQSVDSTIPEAETFDLFLSTGDKMDNVHLAEAVYILTRLDMSCLFTHLPSNQSSDEILNYNHSFVLIHVRNLSLIWRLELSWVYYGVQMSQTHCDDPCSECVSGVLIYLISLCCEVLMMCLAWSGAPGSIAPLRIKETSFLFLWLSLVCLTLSWRRISLSLTFVCELSKPHTHTP